MATDFCLLLLLQNKFRHSHFVVVVVSHILIIDNDGSTNSSTKITNRNDMADTGCKSWRCRRNNFICVLRKISASFEQIQVVQRYAIVRVKGIYIKKLR